MTRPLAPPLDHLPAPLLEEFVAGRWLPIVGAGLSRNAETESGAPLPDWERLGAELGRDLPQQYARGSALEVISAYEHRYGRGSMTTRVARALQLGKARPGEVHTAFASLSFETVVTTNVEQLLEDAYRQVRGSVFTVIEDGQLRMANPYEAPTLVKLHGDLHSPSSLVLTEDDYDRVPQTRPLMLTWLASQLIQKTGVLIGYSLEDWDMRAILAGLRDRLGSVPPDLWVLTVGDDPVTADRYRRRGVRVAELPETPDGWGVLTPLFRGLAGLWRRATQEQLSGTTSVVDAALRADRPVDSLVLFLVDADRLRLYSDYVFPEVARVGLLPVSRADVRAPAGLGLAAVDGLLRVAGLVVVEADDESDPQYAQAVRIVSEERVLRVADLSRDAMPVRGVIARPVDRDEWEDAGPDLAAELSRRRAAAARASAFPRPGSATSSGVAPPGDEVRSETLVALVDLETALRSALPAAGAHLSPSTASRLSSLLDQAVAVGLVAAADSPTLAEVAEVRDALFHRVPESVTDARIVRVRDWCRRVVGQLRAQEPPERPPDDVDALLREFAAVDPDSPHRAVAEGLRGLRYLPHSASPNRYVRWHYSAPGGRVTLYQDRQGLVLDSRNHGAFGAALPGAQVRGRRVLFSYTHASLQEILGAADALRHRVDPDLT